MASVSPETETGPEPETGVVELVGRCALEHTLGPWLVELARFKTRQQLLRSELYRRLSPELERVSFGMEYASTGAASVASAVSTECVRVVAWNIQLESRLHNFWY